MAVMLTKEIVLDYSEFPLSQSIASTPFSDETTRCSPSSRHTRGCIHSSYAIASAEIDDATRRSDTRATAVSISLPTTAVPRFS